MSQLNVDTIKNRLGTAGPVVPSLTVTNNATVGGALTVSDLSSSGNLSISGISTFTNGPVLVGSATSTGTASQRLQVTGDAYVSGNLGIGTTNPTSKLHVAGDLAFNSGYGSVAIAYGCRAWVNFNGTGTVAIRASGNVSSITDNGTGDYTVNFTTAMVDANYVVNHGAIYTTANGWFHFYLSKSSGSTRLGFITTAGSYADMSDASVAIFR